MDRQRIFQRVKHEELAERIKRMLSRRPNVPAKPPVPPTAPTIKPPSPPVESTRPEALEEETAPITPPPAHIMDDPAPAPAVAPAEPTGDTPDLENMTPEQMMEWMESLAKRQGADASGFMTKASMSVQEVDPSTVDKSVLAQEYIPHGWSEERWQEQLKKEAEAKKGG